MVRRVDFLLLSLSASALSFVSVVSPADSSTNSGLNVGRISISGKGNMVVGVLFGLDVRPYSPDDVADLVERLVCPPPRHEAMLALAWTCSGSVSSSLLLGRRIAGIESRSIAESG